MAKFYFTYGSEGHPFFGGWTEVEAENIAAASKIFEAIHPCKTPGVLNCSFVYDEDSFHHTVMPTKGNFGLFCHEKIAVTVTTMEQEGESR